jgi:hypothetical protein
MAKGVQYSGKDFDFHFARLRRAVASGIVDPQHGTVPYQAARLVESVLKLTDPKTQKKGRDVVARDFTKVVISIDPAQIESKSLRKIVQKGDVNAWNDFRNKLNGATAPKWKYAEAVTSLTRADLKKWRDKTGRVRVKRPRYANLGASLKPGVKAALTAAQLRVGRARAGWMASARSLGLPMQSWVTRHGEAFGYIQKQIGQDSTMPEIRFGNRTPWAQGGRAESQMRAAMSNRTAAMQTYFKKMMQLAKQKVGG